MHLAHSLGRLRRGSAFALLGVVLAVTTLSLSQCRMVDERLTGVAVSPAKASNCMNQCAKVWNDSVRVENSLHVENVLYCTGDSVCLAIENARWAQVAARLDAGRLACQNNCHHQGSGGGR